MDIDTQGAKERAMDPREGQWPLSDKVGQDIPDRPQVPTADRTFPMPGGVSDAELATRFTYHAPTGDQPARYVRLRGLAHSFAATIVESTPPSREQSLALTALEEAVFWANAAIARREP